MTAGSPVPVRHRDLLHDARRTLERAAAAERQYLDGRPFRAIHQYDPRAGRYAIRIEVTTALPDELPLLVGQVVRAGRGSLDALAAALVPASSSPRAVRFPIHDSLPEFAQRSRRAISAMREAAQATIEEFQPYHTFGGFRKDSLWLLRELSLAAIPALAAGRVRGDSELGVNTNRHVAIAGDLRVEPGAFESGAIVVDIPATVSGRDPKLDLYFRPSFELAFASHGPASGAPLVATLAAALERVERVMDAVEGAAGFSGGR